MRAAGWCSIPTRAQGGALEATTPGTLADQKPLTRPLCRGVIEVKYEKCQTTKNVDDARCDAARASGCERIPTSELANSNKTLSSKGV